MSSPPAQTTFTNILVKIISINDYGMGVRQTFDVQFKNRFKFKFHQCSD